MRPVGGRSLVYGGLHSIIYQKKKCLLDGLRSMGGFQVASVVFHCQWVAYAFSFIFLSVGGLRSFFSSILFASGWLTLILLVFYIFLPVGGLRVASGFLTQILSVIFLPLGGLLVARSWFRSVLFVCFFLLQFGLCFPVLVLSDWAALGLKRAAPKGCVCCGGSNLDLEESSYFTSPEYFGT